MPVGPQSFGRLSIWAVLANLVNQGIGAFTLAGNPTDGTSGSFANMAALGSIVVNTLTGDQFVNRGTKASPIWKNVTGSVSGNGGLGLVNNAKMTYDFTVNGGAVSTITPTNSPTLPLGAIIFGGTLDITTSLTSGGSATIAVGIGSGAQVASIKGATAVASWGAGQLAVIPVFTAATYHKVTAAGALTLTIATATLTAGKFDVNLMYLRGN